MTELNIEAFILCWNEEKLIQHTINHYKTFCNKITIIDNESTDNTLEIARKNNINIKQYNTNNKLQDSAYVYLKNNVWKQSTADFVVVCDMDEYLYHPDLINQLKEAKKNGVGVFQTEGYNMVTQSFPEDYFTLLTIQIKTGVRATNFDKLIIFSPNIMEEMLYGPGAHTCNPLYKRNASRVTHPIKLKLLHYKYLGIDYLIDKHAKYASRLSEYNKKNNFGGEYLHGSAHVFECYDLIKKSKKIKDVI